MTTTSRTIDAGAGAQARPRKVLIIGSGPIVIGQAAEFDYAGTQACKAVREEGMEVVLINSNPATIMTDTNMAERVYVEPLTLEFAARIIEQERPQGLLGTLGGQPRGPRTRRCDARSASRDELRHFLRRPRGARRAVVQRPSGALGRR